MQPKGVMLACQSCPERWHGKPHKGVCVLRVLPGNRLRVLGAGTEGPKAGCWGNLLVNSGGLLGCWRPSKWERTRFTGCLLLLGEVSGASEIMDAHSKKCFRANLLLLLAFWFPLLPWACSLASFYGCRNRNPRISLLGPPRESKVTKDQAGF